MWLKWYWLVLRFYTLAACIEVLYFGCLKLMWKLLHRFTTLVRPGNCPFLCEGAVLHGDNHIASWRQNATLNESKPVAMAVFPPHLSPCAQWEEDPMVAPHSESGTPPSRLCPPPPSPHTPLEAWMALPSHAPHDHPPATKPMEQISHYGHRLDHRLQLTITDLLQEGEGQPLWISTLDHQLDRERRQSAMRGQASTCQDSPTSTWCGVRGTMWRLIFLQKTQTSTRNLLLSLSPPFTSLA